MNELQKFISFMDEQIRRADEVNRRTNSVLKAQGWDIDKAISQGKKQAELLRAGYTPSQVLKMTEED